jgi:hypothetical protein
MPRARKKAITRSPKNSAGGGKPRCLAIASKGVQTGSDFAALMSATISDLITGAISPQVGNAVCNAGGKLLKVVEMQHKYGASGAKAKQELQLAPAQEASRN